MSKQRHPVCNLEDSVEQQIHLILKTHFTEYRYDGQFGCYVWDKDFDNILSVSRWKDELEDLVFKSLLNYEKRLKQIKVLIEVDEPVLFDPKTNKQINYKKRIIIKISGIIKMINQPFSHTEYMFFSPLSLA